MSKILYCASLSIALAACGKSKTGDDSSAKQNFAVMSLLFAPGESLEGNPNLFSLDLTLSNKTIVRRGDLPQNGETLTFADLPPGLNVRVEAQLFQNDFKSDRKTHACQSVEPIDLIAGQEISSELTCYNIKNPDVPIRVFLKLAKLNLVLRTEGGSALLGNKSWNEPLLFAEFDDTGRRITLRSRDSGLVMHIGGELSLLTQVSLSEFLKTKTTILSPYAGRRIDALSENATLRLTGEPKLYHDGGTFRALLPIKLTNESESLVVFGDLIEERPQSEFTVVSYNVENLFDQTDDTRNDHYNDYRIAPNAKGFASNYGQPVQNGSNDTSFTDVKIANIRRTLLALDPEGPDIVCLQEIESEAALDALFAALSDLGYTSSQFTEWPDGSTPNAIGAGVISKFPITAWSLIEVPLLPVSPPRSEPLRRILKTQLDVGGHPLWIYNNHWKSKGGPESYRKAAGIALKRDIDILTRDNLRMDYIILGDLNSNYNEAVTLEPRHNDTNGETGINTVLKAQGDELAVLRGNPLRYNLHYELDRAARFTAFHTRFGWSGLDHIIIGPGMYDRSGITYVDNSFQIGNILMPRIDFLFRDDGTTKRWIQERDGRKFTTHKIGGYSDHLPLYARFHIHRQQSRRTIWLNDPSRPDGTDASSK